MKKDREKRLIGYTRVDWKAFFWDDKVEKRIEIPDIYDYKECADDRKVEIIIREVGDTVKGKKEG